MLPSLIITFREVLEATLIIGIILGYLSKTKQAKYNNVVYLGIVFGIIASLIGAVIFNRLAEGFSGRAEEIFEGITMLIGALLLTTMIIWMKKQKRITKKFENKVALELTHSHKFGLFFLVFVSILREGVETVIFLNAASYATNNQALWGSLAGLIMAIILGFAVFMGSLRINIKKFFNITSLLLVLFAAGLVALGLHELQEANVIPYVIEHIWDINPTLNSDGSFPLWHENGIIGSFLKGLFGYNGNPSLVETGGYFIYLIAIYSFWKKPEN